MLGQDQQAGLARQAAAEKRRHASEIMAAAAAAVANLNAPSGNPKPSAPSGDIDAGARAGTRGLPAAVPEDLEDPFGKNIPNWLSGDDARPPQAKPKAVRTPSGPDPFPWEQFADGNAEQNLDLLVAWSSNNTSRTSVSAFSDETAALDPETDFQAEPWVEPPPDMSRQFAPAASCSETPAASFSETPPSKSRRKKPRLAGPRASAPARERAEGGETPRLGDATQGGAAVRSNVPAWPLSDTFSFERLENAVDDAEVDTPTSAGNSKRDALKDALADLHAAWGAEQRRAPSKRDPSGSLAPGCTETRLPRDEGSGERCVEERNAGVVEKISASIPSPGSVCFDDDEAAPEGKSAGSEAARSTQRLHANASPRDKSKARHVQGPRSSPRHRVHFRNSICEHDGRAPAEDTSHDHKPVGSPDCTLNNAPEMHVDLRGEAQDAGLPKQSAVRVRSGGRPCVANGESSSCTPPSPADVEADARPHPCPALAEINGNAQPYARNRKSQRPSVSFSDRQGDPGSRSQVLGGHGEQENVRSCTPMLPAKDRPPITWTPEDRRLLQKARARRQAQQWGKQCLSRHTQCSSDPQHGPKSGSVPQVRSQEAAGAPQACPGRRPGNVDAAEPADPQKSVLETDDWAGLWGRLGKASGEIERLILFAEVCPSRTRG